MKSILAFVILMGMVCLVSGCASVNTNTQQSEVTEAPPSHAQEAVSPTTDFAADSQQLPNLAEAFPTEKTIVSHREGAIEWYMFETEVDFNELKEELRRFLGQGWVEADDDLFPEVGGANTGFLNPRYPSIGISLHVRGEVPQSTPKRHVAHILKSDSANPGSRKITLTALMRTFAEGGDMEAQICLGLAYFNGDAVGKDVGEAIKWWRQAAEQGAALAQFSLGFCYYFGQGVEKNYAEAVRWYRKAAEQNNPEAEFGLGVCYSAGQGVTENGQEAMNWYRKAAEQGHVRAQLNLGISYHLGQCVRKDDVEAYAWCSVAAKTDGHAAACRDDLEKGMTPNELASAKKRIEELGSHIKAKSPNNGRPK